MLAFEQLWAAKIIEKSNVSKGSCFQYKVQYHGFEGRHDAGGAPWISEYQIVYPTSGSRATLSRLAEETFRSSTGSDGEDEDEPQQENAKSRGKKQIGQKNHAMLMAGGKEPRVGDSIFVFEQLWSGKVLGKRKQGQNSSFQVHWDGFSDQIERPWISEHQLVISASLSQQQYLFQLADDTFANFAKVDSDNEPSDYASSDDNSSIQSEDDETAAMEQVSLQETLELARAKCNAAIRRAGEGEGQSLKAQREARLASLSKNVLENLDRVVDKLPKMRHLDDKYDDLCGLGNTGEAREVYEFRERWKQAETLMKMAVKCITGEEQYSTQHLNSSRQPTPVNVNRNLDI